MSRQIAITSENFLPAAFVSNAFKVTGGFVVLFLLLLYSESFFTKDAIFSDGFAS